MIPFGKYPDEYPPEMGARAALEAVKDAGLEWKNINGVIGASQGYRAAGVMAASGLTHVAGEYGVPALNISEQSASSGAAMVVAYNMVTTGIKDIVMVAGYEKSPSSPFHDPQAPKRWGEYNAPWPTRVPVPGWSFASNYLMMRGVGASNPAYWALYTQMRMQQYGTTEEDLALARVTSSRNAQHNPNAWDKKAYTVDEVLASPYVCPPLRLLELTGYSDGAAAVILGSVEEAKKHTSQPIILAGVGQGTKIWGDPLIAIPSLAVPVTTSDTPALSESVMAARRAYEQAGVGPEDLDLVELPDHSSWHYFAYMEAQGLCPPGEAEKLVREGATAVGGRIPVNPSGGASSMGECFPVLGLAQACEIAWQLRGQAGARQVAGAKVGLGQVIAEKINDACFIMKK